MDVGCDLDSIFLDNRFNWFATDVNCESDKPSAANDGKRDDNCFIIDVATGRINDGII